jgi:formate/nitrite transporter FocA (FNT family)
MTSDDEGSSGSGDRPREPEVEEAFDRLVSEGSDRLARPLVPLLVTGFVGGIDVGVGVLAYLVVDHETGQPLLAAAAFPVGFIALLLARSELFTENFLVPVTARIAGRGSWPRLIRLWLVTLAANLAGGIVMAAMIVYAAGPAGDRRRGGTALRDARRLPALFPAGRAGRHRHHAADPDAARQR